jgi:putative ABC transport system permease protein
MNNLFKDLRYAVRLLMKSPAFTAVAVITLALGIGANTAIFTVVEAALLRSLPYKEPDRLVFVFEVNHQQGSRDREASYPDYLDWKQQANSFEEMAGYTSGGVTLTGADAPEQVRAASVTSNFFPALGIQTHLGRIFLEGEDRPEADRVVLLSHSLWQRRFGSDTEVLGRKLTLGGNSFTVIGVLPAHFKFAPVGEAEMWLPLRPGPMQVSRRYMHWLKVIGRLAPGVTFNQAQTELDTIARRMQEQDPQWHSGAGIRIVASQEQIVGPVKPILLVLLGAVGFVLLIACANVANLLLARSAARQKEFAVRMALGATRGRIFEQLLTESVVLAVAGGVLGIVLAGWGVDLLVAAIPASMLAFMPYLKGLGINFGVLGFTLAVSVLTGVVFGLAPAIQASKPDLNEALKEGGRTGGGSARQSLRSLLVISEIALALVLLIGAGLMMRSVLGLLRADPGFNLDNLLTMQLSLPSSKYSEPEQRIAFHEQLYESIKTLPGVEGVAATSLLPLSGGGDTGSLLVIGKNMDPAQAPEVNVRTVSADYHTMMSIPLIRGRFFTDRDRLDTKMVVVINHQLARTVFPDQDPVGQRVTFGFLTGQPPLEIVGVVGDEKVVSLDVKATMVLYFPHLQGPDSTMALVVRTASEPGSLISAVEREVRALDEDLPVYSAMSMKELVSNSPSTFARRYPALLIGIFAAVALLLASVGIYGVISYAVTQRTHEIGVRMALGATSKDMLRLVVGQGLALTLIGVGMGLVGALALTRFLSSFLFGVGATDPATFAGVSVVLIAVTILACYIPARRAAKVDPMVALRYE